MTQHEDPVNLLEVESGAWEDPIGGKHIRFAVPALGIVIESTLLPEYNTDAQSAVYVSLLRDLTELTTVLFEEMDKAEHGPGCTCGEE